MVSLSKITTLMRSKSPAKRKLRPLMEGLEDRKLLYATLGDAWTYPVRITYSMVPDGTNVGGLSSNLYSSMNQQATTAAWQLAIAKAASYWSSYAHINIAQVSDNGTPLGGTGDQQGDPNFGDIRISMVNEGNNGILASTFLPPPSNGGSIAGDIVLNSYYTIKVNANYDLQTIMMHEFGHALGMDHSTTPSADMYPYYQGLNQAPTSDDIAGIQSIYGANPTDTGTNTTVNTPTNITPLMTSNGQVTVGNLNLAGASDLDWFYVTAPANTTGTMTVTMQASGLSMLNPRVAVYNSAKTGLAQASSTTNLGGNETVTITGVTAGQGYYIRASAATAPGAVGAYGLLVNFGSSPQALIAPPVTTVAATADQGGGSAGMGSTSDILNKDMAEMQVAINQMATSKASSIQTIVTDGNAILGILRTNGDSTSKARKDLTALIVDTATGNVGKAKQSFANLQSDVIQVGSLAGFGDTMHISAAHTTSRGRKSHAKPSDASGLTVIGTPPTTELTQNLIAHHAKGNNAGSHQPQTVSHGRHHSTAFKLKSGSA